MLDEFEAALDARTEGVRRIEQAQLGRRFYLVTAASQAPKAAIHTRRSPCHYVWFGGIHTVADSGTR